MPNECDGNCTATGKFLPCVECHKRIAEKLLGPNPYNYSIGEVRAASEAGRKFDSGKDRFDLLPWQALRLVVKVMTFGAAKYEANNWQGVEVDRYEAAMMRHYVAWRAGEIWDDESGLPHLAHMTCCALFILAIRHGLDPVRP